VILFTEVTQWLTIGSDRVIPCQWFGSSNWDVGLHCPRPT